MTRLEEEIKSAINIPDGPNRLAENISKAAAEVAKRYIDSAVQFLIDRNTTQHKIGEILKAQIRKDYDQWLKDKGITE